MRLAQQHKKQKWCAYTQRFCILLPICLFACTSDSAITSPFHLALCILTPTRHTLEIFRLKALFLQQSTAPFTPRAKKNGPATQSHGRKLHERTFFHAPGTTRSLLTDLILSRHHRFSSGTAGAVVSLLIINTKVTQVTLATHCWKTKKKVTTVSAAVISCARYNQCNFIWCWSDEKWGDSGLKKIGSKYLAVPNYVAAINAGAFSRNWTVGLRVVLISWPRNAKDDEKSLLQKKQG